MDNGDEKINMVIENWSYILGFSSKNILIHTSKSRHWLAASVTGCMRLQGRVGCFFHLLATVARLGMSFVRESHAPGMDEKRMQCGLRPKKWQTASNAALFQSNS